MKKIFLFIAITICLILAKSATQELKEVKSRLKMVKNELSKLRRTEKNILEEIELLDEKIRLTQSLIRKIKNAQDEKIKEIALLQSSIKDIEERLETKREDLKRRIRLIYKKGEFFDLECLLGAEDMTTLYNRYLLLRLMAKNDRDVLQKLAELKRKLEKENKELESSYMELTTLMVEKKASEESLKNAKKREEKRLSQVKQEKKEKEKLKRELEMAKKRLETMLARMEQRRGKRITKPGTHYLEQKRGNLPWPCRGEIISYFGAKIHPKYGTKTKNDGIDIKCNPGTKINVVSDGRVAFAERYMGYGNLVIVDHGDGYYTIYSNLDEIWVKEGQHVKRGTPLGVCSDYLHFEFRVRGKASNPLLWLK